MRGKQPIPVYVYKYQEYLGETKSIVEAAKMSGVSSVQVRNILFKLTKSTHTRDGYTYSLKPLTEEEIENLSTSNSKNGHSCEEKVEQFTYEIECSNRNVLYHPKSKEGRIEMFKSFIYPRLNDRWKNMPKKLATLERQYVREFFKTI